MLIQSLRLVSVVCLGLLVGCGQSQPTDNAAPVNGQTSETPGEHADPHDVPLTEAEIEKLREETATWAAAIRHIQNYRDTIRTETTGGAPAKAHRALDLLDYVLQWLPEVAQNSSVPKEHWQTIGESSQKLRDAFNAVHANIDDGKDPDYQSVAGEIDAAVDSLTAIPAGESDEANSPE